MTIQVMKTTFNEKLKHVKHVPFSCHHNFATKCWICFNKVSFERGHQCLSVKYLMNGMQHFSQWLKSNDWFFIHFKLTCMNCEFSMKRRQKSKPFINISKQFIISMQQFECLMNDFKVFVTMYDQNQWNLDIFFQFLSSNECNSGSKWWKLFINDENEFPTLELC